MISPYSVINALAMTANGASGETLEQMESVLCGTADCSLDLLNRELQRLQSSMPKEKNNHLYTANSIWYKDSDENFVPADDFLKLNAEFIRQISLPRLLIKKRQRISIAGSTGARME